VRYQLYDGAIFANRYGLTEAAINTSLWAGLALAYYRRGLVSAHLAALYRVSAGLALKRYPGAISQYAARQAKVTTRTLHN
jgi:hypothetical protein